MKITSSGFQNNSKIPEKYTCDGENINPPLSFSDIPQNAKSLVLIMDDPDAPMGTFVHWVLFNIDSRENGIAENSSLGTEGLSTTEKKEYIGPCPPSGTHRYFFKLYALDTALNLPSTPDKKAVEEKMQGHIIEKAELIGLYNRRQESRLQEE